MWYDFISTCSTYSTCEIGILFQKGKTSSWSLNPCVHLPEPYANLNRINHINITYAPYYYIELYQMLWPMIDTLYLLVWSSSCTQATSVKEARCHTSHKINTPKWLMTSLQVKKKEEGEKMTCQRSMTQKKIYDGNWWWNKGERKSFKEGVSINHPSHVHLLDQPVNIVLSLWI